MVVKLTKPMCKTQIIITVKHCLSIQTVFIVSEMQTAATKKNPSPTCVQVNIYLNIAQRPYSSNAATQTVPKYSNGALGTQQEEQTYSHNIARWHVQKLYRREGTYVDAKIFNWSKVRHMLGSFTNPHLHATQL
jgi:hypothetical protein